MALAHVKTYNFRHVKFTSWGFSTADNDKENAQKGWIALRDMFVGGGWKVASSHDGVGNFGNNDDVDHFTSFDQLNRSPNSNRIWIVFEAPAALNNMQICFSTEFSTGVSWLHRWTCRVSTDGGFGASGGGTDGTATAAPTATDQVVAWDDRSPTDEDSGTYNTSYNWHAAESTDGEHLVISCSTGVEQRMFLCFQKVATPHPNLDNGIVWNAQCSANTNGQDQYSATDTLMDRGNHYTLASWNGKISGVNRTFYLGGPGFNNTGLSSRYRVIDNRRVTPSPCDLWHNGNLPDQGYYGTLIDIYWAADNHFATLMGDSVGASAQWWSGGALIIPWDTSEPNIWRK